MKNYTIRRATEDDKEEVLKLHEDDLDYLPAYYDYFLRATHILSVVMILKGKIIAYGIGELVDDGDTIVPRAGRVHPDAKGRRVLKHIKQYIADWGRSKGARTEVFTVFDSNKVYLRPSFQREAKFVCTKKYTTFFLSRQKIKEVAYDSEATTSDLDEVSDAELSRLFQSSEISKYLSLQGRLVVNLVPFKFNPSNIPIIRGPEGFTNVYSDIRQDGRGYTGLLSVGTHFKVKIIKFKYVLDIFGTDTWSLDKHLVKHLTILRDDIREATTLLIYVQKEFDFSKLFTICERFGLKRLHSSDSICKKLEFSQLFVFEGLDKAPESKY